MSKRQPRKSCKQCGKTDVYISRNGLCNDCSSANILKSIEELQNKSGKNYEKWKKNLSKALNLNGGK